MDKYKIDSHKLMYHIPRLHAWLDEKLVYPVYIEISPSGACNHRCTFCALDYVGYQKRYLETTRLKAILSEMGQLGVKSVMFGGEGEPLLHKEICDIVVHARRSGIVTAFTTNGVLLRKSLADKILPQTEWIKVSCNAGTRETYARIHRTRQTDFDAVIENMAYAAELKHKQGYLCALGVQLLLLPENGKEVLQLAAKASDIGMDYLVIKPYSQHFLSKTEKYKNITYKKWLHLANELARFNNEHFKVIFRLDTMQKWDTGVRSYERCLALPFWSYLDAGGNIWGCSAFLGEKQFWYGNIYENSFQKIWESETRLRSLRWTENEFDINQCRINCRMDKINRFLWELRHPPEHVNFI